MRIIIPLLVVLSVLSALPAAAQNTSANISIARRPCTCSGQSSGLSLGTWTRPLNNASGTITTSASTGNTTSTNLNHSGSGYSPGSITVSGNHCNSIFVSTSFPTSITGPGTLSFSGNWARQSGSTYSTIAGSTDNISGTGEGWIGSRGYRLGGSVTINTSTPEGTYSGTITVSITCS